MRSPGGGRSDSWTADINETDALTALHALNHARPATGGAHGTRSASANPV